MKSSRRTNELRKYRVRLSYNKRGTKWHKFKPNQDHVRLENLGPIRIEQKRMDPRKK